MENRRTYEVNQDEENSKKPSNLSGALELGEDIINEIATLLAQNKLVPFFGAGISRRHLGIAAAELAQEMALLVGRPSDTLLSELADDFAQKLGEATLINFLKEKLVLAEVDDTKVQAHRLLISLSPSLIYTTNQDNIFELVAQNYGRHYRRVVTLDDLSDASPGEPLLIKFHGDLETPSSLVFGHRSYITRLNATDHPLDIKFRADLLGKRLVFIGYSFRDENVTKLLSAVQRVFGGKLPHSYLVAFEYDRSMEILSREFGIQIVDPCRFCAAAATRSEAFERCLKAICDGTIKIQAKRGLDEAYSQIKINPRMVTDFEISAVAGTVDTGPVNDALASYRAIFDKSHVPISSQQEVTDLFIRLVARTDPGNDGQMNVVKGALFNF